MFRSLTSMFSRKPRRRQSARFAIQVEAVESRVLLTGATETLDIPALELTSARFTNNENVSADGRIASFTIDNDGRGYKPHFQLIYDPPANSLQRVQDGQEIDFGTLALWNQGTERVTLGHIREFMVTIRFGDRTYLIPLSIGVNSIAGDFPDTFEVQTAPSPVILTGENGNFYSLSLNLRAIVPESEIGALRLLSRVTEQKPDLAISTANRDSPDRITVSWFSQLPTLFDSRTGTQTAAAARFTIAIYQSLDQTFDASDRLVSEQNVISDNPYQRQETTIQLPESVLHDCSLPYYFFAVLDSGDGGGQVRESREDNNVVRVTSPPVASIGASTPVSILNHAAYEALTSYQHAAVLIVPTNQDRWRADPAFREGVVGGNTVVYMTLSASHEFHFTDQSWTLRSDRNRAMDLPTQAFNVELASVCLPDGLSEDAFIETLLQLDLNYRDSLPYIAIPTNSHQYNSNSYVSGLLQAAGGAFPVISPATHPGFQYPVPASEFAAPTPRQTPTVPVFVIGSDNQVYTQKFDSSGASGSPYMLTRPGAVKTIEVGIDAGGNALLFAIGGDDQVYVQRFDAYGNSASAYALLGAGAVKAIAIGHDGGNNPEVFVIGSDDQVYAHKLDADGNPAGTYFFVAAGAVKSLAVVSDASNRPQLFVTGTDSQVYSQRFNASGNPSGSYFLAVAGAVNSVALGRDARQNPELFVIGGDNQAYAAKFDGTGRAVGGYFLLAAGAVTTLQVGFDASGNQQLFTTGPDRQVYALKCDASGSASGGFFLVQRGTVKSLSVGRYGPGNPELFVVGGDDQLYTKTFDAIGNAIGPYTLTRSGRIKAVRASH